MLIKELPEEEKPRERFKNFGVKNLSTADLIAIILRTGTKEKSVKDLASEVAKYLEGLNNYESLSMSNLTKIKGLGEVKAISLLSAVELGCRILSKKTIKKPSLTNPKFIYELFRYDFKNSTQETLIAIFLDTRKQIIACKEIFRGTTNTIITHPREIFKEAISNSAVSLILVHNHPSGIAKPSNEDIKFTSSIIKIGKLIEIPLVDHIIIGDDEYYSFYENGVIDK